MILLIDIGHSRIKWASLDGCDFHFGGSCGHRDLPLPALAESLWADLPQPTRVVASVTQRNLSAVLAEWSTERWGLRPEVVVPQASGYGVVNAYVEPSQLGADRWAALVAARERHRSLVCIVDCGTAMTMDVLSSEGEHLGGLIVPGLQVMRRALVENVQGISAALELKVDSRVALFARDTAGGVAGGTLYAVVALIDRVIADLTTELDATPKCLICGGDASRVLPLLSRDFQHEPHLVLQGLAAIAAGR